MAPRRSCRRLRGKTLELSRYKLPNIELLQSSHARALSAATRLFAFCDTKWTDFLLPGALAQLDEDILALAINLRRVLEATGQKISNEITPHFHAYAGYSEGEYDRDLWRVLGRLVHHQNLEPTIIEDPEFYGPDERISGYMVTDMLVTSDHGKSRVDLAGLAFSAANELGIAYKNAK